MKYPPFQIYANSNNSIIPWKWTWNLRTLSSEASRKLVVKILHSWNAFYYCHISFQPKKIIIHILSESYLNNFVQKFNQWMKIFISIWTCLISAHSRSIHNSRKNHFVIIVTVHLFSLQESFLTNTKIWMLWSD